MFSALFYLQWQTLRNRLWQRLLRLRNPRYLLGALVGGGYLFLVFRRGFSRLLPGGQTSSLGVPDSTWEFLFALLLLVLALLAWLIPHERAALVFSEAEIAFLFPAPVRRRTLIHYKLVRSQIAVLFTTFFLTLVSRWSGGLGGVLLRAGGWWVLLSAVNLHLLGSSFARTFLLEHGVTHWKRRLLAALALGGALAGAYAWGRAEVPSLDDARPENFRELVAYVGQVAGSRPATTLLAPFRWVVRPLFSSGDTRAFLGALPLGLLVLAVHYLWVVRSDVAFEEASLDASRRFAERTVARQAGRGLAARPPKRRRAPFPLSPTGPPAVALLWKNLLSAGQMFNARFALVLLGWSAFLATSLSHGGGGTVWQPLAAWMAAVLAAWSVVLGPQVVRQDFRQDLAVADLLKVYPLRGWQVALGEILTPAVILTLLQWVCLLVAAILWDKRVAEGEEPAWQAHASLAAAGAILALPLNLVSLLGPNAAALLLPAWFATPTTPGASRGIEVVGQRFIFLIGQFFLLALVAAPVGLTLFVAYALAGRPLLGETWGLPAAAVVAAVVAGAEAMGGLLVLGRWFERFDLSAERPS